MRLFLPRRSFLDVATLIATGLADGSVVLEAERGHPHEPNLRTQEVWRAWPQRGLSGPFEPLGYRSAHVLSFAVHLGLLLMLILSHQQTYPPYDPEWSIIRLVEPRHSIPMPYAIPMPNAPGGYASGELADDYRRRLARRQGELAAEIARYKASNATDERLRESIRRQLEYLAVVRTSAQPDAPLVFIISLNESQLIELLRMNGGYVAFGTDDHLSPRLEPVGGGWQVQAGSASCESQTCFSVPEFPFLSALRRLANVEPKATAYYVFPPHFVQELTVYAELAQGTELRSGARVGFRFDPSSSLGLSVQSTEGAVTRGSR